MNYKDIVQLAERIKKLENLAIPFSGKTKQEKLDKLIRFYKEGHEFFNNKERALIYQNWGYLFESRYKNINILEGLIHEIKTNLYYPNALDDEIIIGIELEKILE